MLLRDMVQDGQIKGVLVDPAWRDPKHPSERVRRKSDPIALRKTAPDLSPIGYTIDVPSYGITARRSSPIFILQLYPGEIVFS